MIVEPYIVFRINGLCEFNKKPARMLVRRC